MALNYLIVFLKSFIELIWIIQEKSLTLQYKIKTNNKNYGNNDNSRD